MARGGKREGAGRPKSSLSKAKSMLDRARLQAELNQHVGTPIDALVDVATHGKSESARVSAATEILNRAVGRPLPAADLNDLVGTILRAMMEATPEELDDAGIGFAARVPLPGLLDD